MLAKWKRSVKNYNHVFNVWNCQSPKILQHWDGPRRVEAGGAEMKLSLTLTSSYASSKRRQQEWMDKSASRDSQRNVEQACVVKKSEQDSQGASPNRFIIMFKNNKSSEK